NRGGEFKGVVGILIGPIERTIAIAKIEVLAIKYVTPRVDVTLPPASRIFPFRFCRQAAAGPFAILARIIPGDQHDRVTPQSDKITVRPKWMPPVGAIQVHPITIKQEPSTFSLSRRSMAGVINEGVELVIG